MRPFTSNVFAQTDERDTVATGGPCHAVTDPLPSSLCCRYTSRCSSSVARERGKSSCGPLPVGVTKVKARREGAGARALVLLVLPLRNRCACC